jgi:perosamine synthetase
MRPTAFEGYPEIGYNFRITDIQAAIGMKQLDRIGDLIARRRKIAKRYNDAIGDHPILTPPYVPLEYEPNWQSYQVSLRQSAATRREEIMDWLYDQGIPTRRGIMASHLEPPYYGMASLPVTEDVARRTIQLPMHSGLTVREQDFIIDALRRIS